MKATQKRTSIYLDSELHRVLVLKAAESHLTISDLVNEAVRSKFAEDEDVENLAVIEKRARKPKLPFEDVLEDLPGC